MSETGVIDGELELLGSEWSLADVVDHLLNRGVCVFGRVTISVAGIDLMYLGVQLVFSSVETLRARTSA